MVFQDYKLIPEMNIWENIALPLSLTGKSNDEIERRVTDLLNLIKIPEKAMLFPSQLSGGEAQRVGIARALSIGPELIIADEPTGNLDPETAQSIARLLKKINELGTTVIIATHDQNILASSPDTRTLVLEKGRLMADADTESLAKKKYSSTKKAEEKKTDESVEKKAEAQTEQKQVDAAKEKEAPKPKKSAPSEKDESDHADHPAHSRLDPSVEEELKEAENQKNSKKPKTSWWSKMFSKAKPDQDVDKNEDENSKNEKASKGSDDQDEDNKPEKKTKKDADDSDEKDSDMKKSKSINPPKRDK